MASDLGVAGLENVREENLPEASNLWTAPVGGVGDVEVTGGIHGNGRRFAQVGSDLQE